jgi:hypothetical protein
LPAYGHCACQRSAPKPGALTPRCLFACAWRQSRLAGAQRCRCAAPWSLPRQRSQRASPKWAPAARCPHPRRAWKMVPPHASWSGILQSHWAWQGRAAFASPAPIKNGARPRRSAPHGPQSPLGLGQPRARGTPHHTLRVGIARARRRAGPRLRAPRRGAAGCSAALVPPPTFVCRPLPPFYQYPCTLFRRPPPTPVPAYPRSATAARTTAGSCQGPGLRQPPPAPRTLPAARGPCPPRHPLPSRRLRPSIDWVVLGLPPAACAARQPCGRCLFKTAALWAPHHPGGAWARAGRELRGAGPIRELATSRPYLPQGPLRPCPARLAASGIEAPRAAQQPPATPGPLW